VTVSSVTLSALGQLISEFGGHYFGKGINSKSPLLKSGNLKTVDADGSEYTVTLYPTANHATGFALDGGYLPVGGTGIQVIARAMPTVLVSKLQQGRAASKMKIKGKERTKQLDVEMKQRAADCGRILNRALIGGSMTATAISSIWSAAGATGEMTATFTDVSMFREGMAVDVRDVSASVAYTVRVKSIAAVGAGSSYVAGSVTFINDILSPATNAVVNIADLTPTTSDIFELRGATAGFGGASALQGALPNSFDSMSGSSGATASFMGVDPSTVGPGYGWKGNYKSLGAAYSQEAALGFLSFLGTVSDEQPDVIVCHPQTAAAHAASGDFHGAMFGVSAGLSASRTRGIERSTDKYGNVYEDDGLRLGGAKVVQDPNCQPGRLIMFSSEHTKLAVWAEMGPDSEGGDAVLLGRTYYTAEVQFSGLYQLVTDARNTVGILDGISNL
jgi:hypothetical protein